MSQRTRSRIDHSVRRQQILDKAIAAISRVGYQGMTVQALAQACGLTNGGLLYYFGSKEQLLIAVLEERDRRESHAVSQSVVIEIEPGPNDQLSRDTILALMHLIVERSLANPELLRLHTVLQAEALNADHPAYDYFLRRQELVLSEFSDMFNGYLDDPRTAARCILALLEGLTHQWLRADHGFDLVAACDSAVARFFPERSFGDME